MELTLKTNKNQADFISEVLTGLEAVSVTFEDSLDEAIFEPPVGETPLWDNTTVRALFDVNVNQAQVQTKLEQICQIKHGTFKRLKNRVWEDECKKNFQAKQFGKRLWICPSWEEASVLPDDAVVIDMDPGLAFGTGSHQTTDLCLQYLDKYPPIGQTLIDYGTGSGVLAIAAIKLGATQAVAIDNDPQAILASGDNIKRNQVDASVQVLHSDDEGVLKQTDMLIANILANPLIELCAHFAGLVKQNGQIILSGILHSQLEAVLAAYGQYFDDLQAKEQDDWCLIFGVKK